MSYVLRYHEKVIKEDIPTLHPSIKIRIKTAVESKLTKNPEIFGKPLRRSLRGYRKLRVGNYRVVFLIQNKTKTIIIVAIKHRSIVYRN